MVYSVSLKKFKLIRSCLFSIWSFLKMCNQEAFYCETQWRAISFPNLPSMSEWKFLLCEAAKRNKKREMSSFQSLREKNCSFLRILRWFHSKCMFYDWLFFCFGLYLFVIIYCGWLPFYFFFLKFLEILVKITSMLNKTKTGFLQKTYHN